ncbi:MAG: chemotaxis protein MotA [Moorella sp. (in: firmicutes)]|uniref:Chemotaxis protein PomA n=1 Tax=Neomoorella thermoacetica TaxID=1525 RepID=A0A1J5NF51_NEOTH|nr:chemotaxis protein MotA [Moorella sp. (in: firmicutes)]OIQ57000.1 chemotaxis protein PomA [Moorella thermoacetica]
MDLNLILGLLIGFGSLIAAFILEGGSPGALLAITAAMIVFGGTIGATLIGLRREEVLNIPRLLKVAFREKPLDLNETINAIVNYAVLARKEGFVRLEKELAGVKDNFLRTALQLVVDGTDPEQTRNILEQYIYATSERHHSGISLFEAAGGYAPTMGIIGTVMGLVHVLSNLSTPDKLGPSIAMAFIATLYGVSSANLLWLPIATKLKNKDARERLYQEMILEGVLALQAGKNPTLIRNTLAAFLAPGKEREGWSREAREVNTGARPQGRARQQG